MSRHLAQGLVLCLLIFVTVAAVAEDHPPHWSYSGATGPAHWGDLSPDYLSCKTGKAQSPIDITQAIPLPVSFTAHRYRSVPVSVVNNGHTIEVDVPPANYFIIQGKYYELQQFHFHAPSEHAFHGRRADMVAHMVHKAADGEIAVIAVPMVIGAYPNHLISTLWEAMPRRAGESARPWRRINPARLLPTDRHRYYTYTGSLTTPPCTEGVRWLVMAEPITVTAAQVAQFKALIGPNTRPLQPLNGRPVFYNR